MTVKEAYRILGLTPGAKLQEIKKKYRELMMQVHPDTNSRNQYPYTVQEINAAYSVLKGKIFPTTEKGKHHNKDKNSEKKADIIWNAPINRHAYTERDVLQYVEDYDGAILGNFCIARGKYMWTTDEDFSLFLRSLYQCSKQILDEADTLLNRDEPPAGRTQFQAELTYLLTQQFISQTALLQEISKEEKTGYLSFPDDRLYYIVVPLFEQKTAQVKIQVSAKQPERKKRSATNYRNLHLWIKLSDSACQKMPENLNIEIERLLEKYKR
ncbi:MAG: DnaJ domain-containing protein [Bacillus sp. (in: Bacteria)]|nr:DnaJ domain-containing protein [Bacillus sp. (in: firmicutes)]MCM1426505.1 DnaJ domain-containing protein [Eubacterium sp.]